MANREVKIAIVGLGNVGSTFLRKLLEKKKQEIKVIAVAEKNSNTPGINLAKGEGIKVYSSHGDLLSLGEGLDIIFNLTGDASITKDLRDTLDRSGNHHTVIAPEAIAFLVWSLIAEGIEFPEHKAQRDIDATLKIIERLQMKKEEGKG
jgi:glyceraldehyde-3-phosphate dehydrogenase/erythrose-4-phosphate dehydrogenase